MTYKYFEIEFHRVKELFDLEKPIEVFGIFMGALGENIQGAHFNKYYEPPHNPHPRIAVRLDFEDEDIVREIVLRVAKELEEREEIRYYDKELKDCVEPDFVLRAHEIGTACALELKNWMAENQDVYRSFRTDPRRKAGFMTQLISLLLEQTGLQATVAWSILRESPTYEKDELRDEERVVNLARTCAIECREGLKELEKRLMPDFLERLVHAFYNCTYTLVDTQVNTEGQVLSWFRTSLLWKHIGNSSVESRLVEVYGSLLNPNQRKGIRTKEAGKVERTGWKLSFDRLSSRRGEAVLNLVETGDPEYVYYRTVYRVDGKAYNAILEREMGKPTGRKWKRGKRIDPNSYRPIQLDSEFGITDIFIIPEEGRRPTATNSNAIYVKIVRKGIEESHCGHQREVNLQALERAVKESQTPKK